MNTNVRILITNYFDELTRDLDIKVERLIRDNNNDDELVANINRLRETFIAEIRACEAINLAHHPSHFQQASESKKKEEEKPLFVSFCFFIRICQEKSADGALLPCYINCENMAAYIGFRLVVVDKYLSRAQIRCFEELIKFTPNFLLGIKEKEKDLFFDVMSGVSCFYNYKLNILFLYSCCSVNSLCFQICPFFLGKMKFKQKKKTVLCSLL
jgi:hypothetical protein